tara:strand:+ start:777 stop:1421 length:645 start_codon:yes stop_codon:yes gene_type:complete
MIESQLKFEDEEKIQQKNEWYVCHMGMFGGGGSTRFDPDRVRNLPAFGSVGQMGNTPVPGQREVRVGRDLYEFQGGGRDGAGGYQFVGSMPEETFQAIQPKPKPQPAPKTQERPQPVAQAAAPRPVQPQMSTPSGSQASDMNSYIDEIQARYDMQITEMKNLIDAGNLAREQQLQDLTTKTQERKERVKKPRRYGRRSLLTGSELGVQNETLGG